MWKKKINFEKGDYKSFLANGRYRNIGITGVASGVGTTFTATGLAYYVAAALKKDVCFTQCCMPEECTDLIYYTLGVDKRSMNTYRGLYSKKGSAEGCRAREEYNLGSLSDNCWIDGINWRVISPADLKCKNENFHITDHQMDLICKAKGEVNVFDIDRHDIWTDFCNKMDMLIVVLDPMPSKLLRAGDRILKIKIMEDKGLPVA